MAEMIHKEYAGECKVLDAINQTMTMVVSTEDEDREGDIIEAAGWDLKAYKKNPVVLFAHNYSQPPVAKALDIRIEDGKLISTLQFAPTPFAQEVWTLYSQGFMRAASVGFLPKRWEEHTDAERRGMWGMPRIYKEQELLEYSLVPVPANANALVSLAVKGLGALVLRPLPESIVTGRITGEATIQRPMPNEHACRLKDPGAFEPDSFRRMERDHEGKTYSVIMGKLKGESTMTEQAYRYPKDTWGAAQARTHCTSHDGSFEAASGGSEAEGLTQDEIKDELAWVYELVVANRLGPEALILGQQVGRLLVDATGGDTPDDVIDKIGAVLNRKNKQSLKEAQDLIQQVLDSAEPAEEPQGESLDPDTIAQLIREHFGG